MLKPGRNLVLGNVACAEGALRVGCRLFAGYPITPANEITEYMSGELPKVGGYFLQRSGWGDEGRAYTDER